VTEVRYPALQVGAGATSLRRYVSFVKPHIDLTFVLVGVTGSALAQSAIGQFRLAASVGVGVSVAFLSAGAECWTNLIDRRIDAAMPRTARRALPMGTISARSASVLGATLTVTGLSLAAVLGLLPFCFLALGLFNNVVVYSALTKRSTPWSILLGSAVGPLTLFAGYTAVSVPISAPALLIGAMVAAWVPVHIWVIATRYREDYSKARVPMAPVVWGKGTLGAACLLASLVMGGLAVGGLVSIGGPAAGPVALGVAAVSGAIAVGSAVLPWSEKLAAPLTRLVTLYLVLVLVGSIGLAL